MVRQISKKIALLSILATVLAGAMQPSGASANWTHQFLELKAGENPTLALTGTSFGFENLFFGGVRCHLTSELRLTGNSNAGHLLKFETTSSATSSCETRGIIKNEGCVVESFTASNLPWNVDNTATPTTLSITTGAISISVIKKSDGSPCLRFPTFDFTPGTLTGTPDSTTAIKTIGLSGSLTSDPFGVSMPMIGTLDVLAPNVGTYGI